jgi:hypothetical protein
MLQFAHRTQRRRQIRLRDSGGVHRTPETGDASATRSESRSLSALGMTIVRAGATSDVGCDGFKEVRDNLGRFGILGGREAALGEANRCRAGLPDIKRRDAKIAKDRRYKG